MHLLFLAVSSFVAAVMAAPAVPAPASQRSHVVHESRDALPAGWERASRLHPDSYFPLRIALTQSNMDRADEVLMSVSDPKSAKFGKHWTSEEITDFFAPTAETLEAVALWLKEAGIEDFKQSASRGWVIANVTVTQAERLLKTKYFEYEHSSGASHVACEHYMVPEDLRERIDFVTPTVHFDLKVKRDRRKKLDISSPDMNVASPSIGEPVKFTASTAASSLSGCNSLITPDCLRALYNIPANATAVSGNSYGIVEYAPEQYTQTSLNNFFTRYAPALVGQAPILKAVDGAVLASTVSPTLQIESDLDLEYGMALVYPQKVTLYQVGTATSEASFNDLLDAFDQSYCATSGRSTLPNHNCGNVATTKVLSTSYGYNEDELTPAYERRQCNEYLKLGLAGTTFLFSSGDYGVAGNGNTCLTNNRFRPAFPGTCPYVTSVGATQIEANGSVTTPEKAAESVIYSGGGFSNVFPQPSYQAAAVAAYYKSYAPSYPSTRYNNSRVVRGYPDIAANGVNYAVAIEGNFNRIYGTSASAPTLGALLTLINAARLANRKAVIGFINPVLYANPTMMNDITKGGNQGCGTPGFSAVPGWDPVTGLGTPDFNKMKKVWLSLP